MIFEEARSRLAKLGITLRQRPGAYHLHHRRDTRPFDIVETLEEALAAGDMAGRPPEPLPPMGPVFSGNMKKHNTALIKSGRWRRMYERHLNKSVAKETD